MQAKQWAGRVVARAPAASVLSGIPENFENLWGGRSFRKHRYHQPLQRDRTFRGPGFRRDSQRGLLVPGVGGSVVFSRALGSPTGQVGDLTTADLVEALDTIQKLQRELKETRETIALERRVADEALAEAKREAKVRVH